MGISAQSQDLTARKDSLRALRDTAKVLVLDMQFWNDYSVIKYTKYDTTLNRTRLYEPTYEVYHFNSSLGNMGTAHQPMIYKVNPKSGFDAGFHAFDLYFFNEDNIRHFKTKRPFTEISYSIGSKSEQNLELLHTQQIVKGFQAGLHFRHYYSEGFYNRQDAVYNDFRIFGNYLSPSGSYKLLFWFTHNDSYVEENGGLENDSTFIAGGIFTGSGFSKTSNRALYPVNLRNALNRWYNNGCTLIQSFVVPRKSTNDSTERDPLFSLVHTFHYTNSEFRYRDDSPVSSFYGAALYDTNLTRHSTFLHDVQNEVKAIFYLRKKYASKSPFVVGAKHQYVDDRMAVQRNQGDTLEPDTAGFQYKAHNISVFARSRVDFAEQIALEASGEFFLAGYNLGNFSVGGNLLFQSKDSARVHHTVRAGVLYRQYNPTYAQTRLITNHISWQNNFGPQRLIHVYADYQVPEWNLWVKANVHLQNNYIYFDTTGVPNQTTDFNAVFSLEASKKVRFWKFFWENTVAGQYATTEFIRVPNLILHSNFYFEGVLFKKSLLLRAGFDVWFFTAYKSYAYNPLTSLFYLQNQTSVGNYPYLDLYISGKIKTVRIFFRVRNVNQRIPSIPYFLTPGYPMQDRSFQVGVSWGFYN